MTTPQTESTGSEAQDDLVKAGSKSKPSSNPFANAASISVSVPETVEVKLVDASALADYEVWGFLTSLLSSASVGFIVTAIQNSGKPGHLAWGIMSAILVVLTIVFGVMAHSKRRKVGAKARRLKFAVGEQVEDP